MSAPRVASRTDRYDRRDDEALAPGALAATVISDSNAQGRAFCAIGDVREAPTDELGLVACASHERPMLGGAEHHAFRRSPDEHAILFRRRYGAWYVRVMRNLFACGVIAIAGLSAAACGGDDKNSDGTPIDAPVVAVDAKAIDAAPDSPTIDAAQESYDFSCEANTAPATVPASLTIAGTTRELTLGGIIATPGVALQLHNPADMTIASTTSDATTAAYSLTADTGGAAFAGSLFATKAGYRRSVIFPPFPVTKNIPDLPTTLITPDNFAFLKNITTITQDDTANGFLLVAVLDCAGARIGGATLHVKQNGVEVGQQYQLSMADPTNGKGVVAVYNVPAGSVEVSASYFAHNLFTHTVRSFAASTAAPDGTLTQTELVPGYPNP